MIDFFIKKVFLKICSVLLHLLNSNHFYEFYNEYTFARENQNK